MRVVSILEVTPHNMWGSKILNLVSNLCDDLSFSITLPLSTAVDQQGQLLISFQKSVKFNLVNVKQPCNQCSIL